MSASMLDLGGERRSRIESLVAAWLAHRPEAVERPLEVVDVEVLRAGRPGLLDVVARIDSRLAHVVLGLHEPGSEVRALGGTDDVVLGEFADESGQSLAVDALVDADLAPLVLVTIVGEEVGKVSVVAADDQALVLDAGDRFTFSVFPWLAEGPHPAVDMLVRLDEVGFNHLAAPIALWRRRGRDLGMVQELLTEAADGGAVARISLRDLYDSRVAPEEAGGDFAAESRSLGTMTARLHLASDRAFGRRAGAVADWCSEVELALGGTSTPAAPEAREAIQGLRTSSDRATTVRTHGDLHLGRTARTNHGWVVADWLPGGVDASGDPRYRSPLCDAASMLWSLRQVATGALEERDQALRPGLGALAEAWVARNRRAFLAGYFATPGITELVPADTTVVEWVVAAFELEAAARRGLGRAG